MLTVIQRVQEPLGEDGVRSREVGCQSDSAETRDAGVQVDLLTQHLSWRLPDGPGGGAVLQQGHLLCLLYPAPHHTPLPTMPLSTPPPAPPAPPAPLTPPPQPWSTELHQAASLPIILQCETLSPPPPGLIAPLSPCLAEEEQEEEQEEVRRTTEEHNHGLTAANHSRELGGRKRGRPRKDEEEERAGQKKRRGAEEQKEEELMFTQKEVKEAIKRVKTEEQEVQQEAEGRAEEQSAADHSKARRVVRRRKLGPLQEGEGGRPRRRTVTPPIRYQNQSEERSHGLTAANHSTATAASEMIQRGRRRVESPVGGDVAVVWKRCQGCGLAFSCQSALRLHQTVHRPAASKRTAAAEEVNTSDRRRRRSQEQRSRLSASLQPPDWSGHGRHVSRKPRWCVGYRSLRRRRGRPRRERDRYPLESEEPSHDPTPANQNGASVCKGGTAPQKKSNAGGGASEVTDRYDTTERQKIHPPAPIKVPDWSGCSRKRQRRAAEEEQQQEVASPVASSVASPVASPVRPRRRMVGPPIRYLLESEEPSHDVTPANQNGASLYKGGTAPQKKSNAGGGASEVTDRCDTIERQKTHPFIPIKAPDWSGCSRKRQMRGAEEVQEQEQEEVRKGGAEEEVSSPVRPRRRMVGPPIRYLLESEEPSHDVTPANQGGASVCKGGTAPQKKSNAGGGASEVTDRCDTIERQKTHPFVAIKAPDWLGCSMTCDGGRSRRRQMRGAEEVKKVTTEEKGGAEEEVASLLLPRRRMVGPPIRYLLESEEPSHDVTPANQNGASVCKGGTAPQKKSNTGGGASEVTDSSLQSSQLTIISPCVRLQRLSVIG